MTLAMAGGPSERVVPAVVDPIQRLIGWETSAQAAYQLAADAAERQGRSERGLLRQLQEEHELAAQSLMEHRRELGCEPAERSGSLGIWSAPAKLAREGGATSLVEQFRAAEQRMLDEYELVQASSGSATAQLLQNLIIPAQQRHVQVLRMLQTATSPQC